MLYHKFGRTIPFMCSPGAIHVPQPRIRFSGVLAVPAARHSLPAMLQRRSIIFANALALAFVLVASGGCGNGPRGLVPVSGKLTYNGVAWDKPTGEVIFSPLSTPTGGHLTPAMARIAPDGSFTAKTIDADGLMPGEYGVAFRCMAKPATTSSEGESALPARYRTPRTSGLKVSVPEGSGPIYVQWNIEDK